MTEWLSMGGYARFVWPSYAVFFLAVIGTWIWAVYQGKKIRRKIRLEWQETE